MPDWLWQTIVGNLVWILLAAVAAAAMGFLKSKGFWMTEPLIYSLTTFVLLMVALVAFSLLSQARSQPRITGANIESYVQQWADRFRFGIQERVRNFVCGA